MVRGPMEMWVSMAVELVDTPFRVLQILQCTGLSDGRSVDR